MIRKDRLVVASLETEDGFRCIDIVRGPDNLYFWDEWRRDPEDPSGWHNTGRQSVGHFATAEDARRDAAQNTDWLPD